MQQRPLSGITVVTLEHAIAAPFCTRQLADLGARVIKVEDPVPVTLLAPTTNALGDLHPTSSGRTAPRKASHST